MQYTETQLATHKHMFGINISRDYLQTTDIKLGRVLISLYLNQTDLTGFLLLSYLSSSVQILNLPGWPFLRNCSLFELAWLPVLYAQKKNQWVHQQTASSLWSPQTFLHRTAVWRMQSWKKPKQMFQIRKVRIESWPPISVGDQPQAGVNGFIIMMEILSWGRGTTQLENSSVLHMQHIYNRTYTWFSPLSPPAIRNTWYVLQTFKYTWGYTHIWMYT